MIALKKSVTTFFHLLCGHCFRKRSSLFGSSFETFLAEESCSGFSRFCDNVLSRKPSSGESKLLGRVAHQTTEVSKFSLVDYRFYDKVLNRKFFTTESNRLG